MSFFCANQNELSATYKGDAIDAEDFGFQNIHLQDAAGSNAYHIPSGSLVVYDPKAPESSLSVLPEKISILDIAPSILNNFGVDIPNHMQKAVHL